MESLINDPIYLFIKDFLSAGLTVWGLIIATKGLMAWKEQIKGSKEFETGHGLSRAILKLRNAIKYVRNPGMWLSEEYNALEYARIKYPNKSEEEIKNKKRAYAYEKRWEKISDASAEIDDYLITAEILWEPKILELIKLLNTKINELNLSLQQEFSEPSLRTKTSKEINDIIYSDHDDDSFSKEIDTTIKEITDYIKIKMK